MKGAQYARDRKTATSPRAGRHRAGRHGGDSRRRVPSGHPGQAATHHSPPRPERRPVRQQAVLRQHGRAVHRQEHRGLPLHAQQRQGHERPDPHLRRHRPGHQVPGRNGQAADVMLGFKTLQDYVTEFDSPPVTANGGPYFGETIGRYGNRIAKGTFSLNQPGAGKVTYTLPINNGVNSLHGGLVGFGNHIWADQPVHGHERRRRAAHAGQPERRRSGAAAVPRLPERLHRLPGHDQGRRDLHPEQRQPARHPLQDHRPVQEPQHGHQPDQPQLLQPGRRGLVPPARPTASSIQINANKYTPTDTTQIPLGYQASVFGTPFNFTRRRQIGARIARLQRPQLARVQPAAHRPGL